MAWKRNSTVWRDDLSQMKWQGFERMLAEHYRRAGYDVEHCGTAVAATRYDGGVDLVLRRDGETVLVQVKHWNVAQVPHNAAHELLGLVETRGATRGILITSGEFTRAAREVGTRSARIELIDGAALRLMVDPRLIPAPEPEPIADAGDLAAWAPVAERTVDALIDVMSGRRASRRRRTLGEEMTSGLMRFAFAAVVSLIVLLFVRHQLEKITTSLALPRTERAVPAPVAAPPPGPAVNARAPVAPVNGFERMTEEELAEWERRNRESMEILEKTTPTLER